MPEGERRPNGRVGRDGVSGVTRAYEVVFKYARCPLCKARIDESALRPCFVNVMDHVAHPDCPGCGATLTVVRTVVWRYEVLGPAGPGDSEDEELRC